MQNSKNHEDEIALRLKFEQKLNDMHRDYRVLFIKNKRAHQDLEDVKVANTRLEKENEKQKAELSQLRKDNIHFKTEYERLTDLIKSL